jgi:hypothetical protein
MAIVVMENVSIWIADRTRRRLPDLKEPAGRRIRQAAWRTAVALVCFTILTAAPAIAWRLRTGVWLDGSP